MARQPMARYLIWITDPKISIVRFILMSVTKWITKGQVFELLIWRFPEIGVPPSSHPFLDGIFPYKPTSYWGTPMTMEIPIPPIPIYISHHIVYKWIIIPFTSSIYHQQKPHLVVSLSLSYPTKHTRIYPAIHLGQPDVPDGG